MKDKAEFENIKAEMRGAAVQIYSVCMDMCAKCSRLNSRWRWLLCRRCSTRKLAEDVDKLLRMVRSFE